VVLWRVPLSEGGRWHLLHAAPARAAAAAVAAPPRGRGRPRGRALALAGGVVLVDRRPSVRIVGGGHVHGVPLPV
jgi:hypothetical protein